MFGSLFRFVFKVRLSVFGSENREPNLEIEHEQSSENKEG